MTTRLLIRGTAAIAAALLAFYSPRAHAQGSLRAWGDDSYGLVSNVPAGNDFVKVCLAESHGIALRADGTIASWGSDFFGEVSGTPNGTFIDVSAGSQCSAALRADGTIVAWGIWNVQAPAGVFARLAPRFTNNFAVGIRADGTLSGAWPGWLPTGSYVEVDFPVHGYYGEYGVALRADGELETWGNFGSMPVYSLSGPFRAISAGVGHIVAIRRSDGTIAEWTDSNWFENYPSPPSGTFISVASGWFTNVGLRTDGSLASWGLDDYGFVSGTPAGNGFVAVSVNLGTGVAIRSEHDPDPDPDNDGLTNTQEAALGTNPNDSDSDDDLLLDGSEVNGSLTDPLDSDSDDDGLSDGTEVDFGTNPNNADTDGDGVGDFLDPMPLTPGVSSSWIEDRLRGDASYVLGLSLDCLEAPNANAAKGRRNAMGNKLIEAANKVAQGDRFGSIDELMGLVEKLDGNANPPDWMVDCNERDGLLAEIQLIIYLLSQP